MSDYVSLQQETILQLRLSVFLGSQNINRPQAQSHRHDTPHVDIHVKCNAQERCLRLIGLRRNSGSESSAVSLSDSSKPRWICASTSL
jgi:hypothetical protein